MTYKKLLALLLVSSLLVGCQETTNTRHETNLEDLDDDLDDVDDLDYQDDDDDD